MLLDKIKNDIGQSLKHRDVVRLETLRFLLSAIQYVGIAKYGAQGESEINDQDVLDVIKKQVKTRRESIDAFSKAQRNDLLEKEKNEMAILMTFLPKELTDDELKKILEPVVQSGEKNFGLLMKQAMIAVNGKADGGRVSAMLKSLAS